MGIHTHRVKITQRMVGGYFTKQVWIIDKAAKVINRLNQFPARRNPYQGSVIRMFESGIILDIIFLTNLVKHLLQDFTADLGAAATTAHRCYIPVFVFDVRHGGQFGKTPYEPAIDSVLEPPTPFPLKGPGAATGNGETIPG